MPLRDLNHYLQQEIQSACATGSTNTTAWSVHVPLELLNALQERRQLQRATRCKHQEQHNTAATRNNVNMPLELLIPKEVETTFPSKYC